MIKKKKRNILNSHLICAFLLLWMLAFPCYASEKQPADSGTDSVEIVMVGDMLMHTGVVESGLQEDGSYNFDHLFAQVKDRILQADLALVNQETILGGTELGLSGYPTFNSPYEVGDAEAKAGFDVILHATNHALDKGSQGILNCLTFWKENYPQIVPLGIHDSQDSQDDNIYVVKQNGISIAILNYTYGTNGISLPKDKSYMIDYLKKEEVIKDLREANALADFVIVCPHWGTEYVTEITEEQKYWTNIFLENGVDLVIGTHPHVIEPVVMESDDQGSQMLVYYSLGNFVNKTSGRGDGVYKRMVGGMADVTIQKDEEGIARIVAYRAIPLVCHVSDQIITAYELSDYSEYMAKKNLIVSQDDQFTYANCLELVKTVWGCEAEGIAEEVEPADEYSRSEK